jgi:hypothetical protein
MILSRAVFCATVLRRNARQKKGLSQHDPGLVLCAGPFGERISLDRATKVLKPARLVPPALFLRTFTAAYEIDFCRHRNLL